MILQQHTCSSWLHRSINGYLIQKMDCLFKKSMKKTLKKMMLLQLMMIKNYKTYPDFEALVDWTLIILILLAISCSISTFLASGEWYCSAILECRYNLKCYGNRISQHNLLVCTLAWNEWKEEQWGLLLNSRTLIDTLKYHMVTWSKLRSAHAHMRFHFCKR